MLNNIHRRRRLAKRWGAPPEEDEPQYIICLSLANTRSLSLLAVTWCCSADEAGAGTGEDEMLGHTQVIWSFRRWPTYNVVFFRCLACLVCDPLGLRRMTRWWMWCWLEQVKLITFIKVVWFRYRYVPPASFVIVIIIVGGTRLYYSLFIIIITRETART